MFPFLIPFSFPFVLSFCRPFAFSSFILSFRRRERASAGASGGWDLFAVPLFASARGRLASHTAALAPVFSRSQVLEIYKDKQRKNSRKMYDGVLKGQVSQRKMAMAHIKQFLVL